jgi:hypothetical protein
MQKIAGKQQMKSTPGARRAGKRQESTQIQSGGRLQVGSILANYS